MIVVKMDQVMRLFRCKERVSLGRPHRLLVNTENKGFTGGHNQRSTSKLKLRPSLREWRSARTLCVS